MPADKRFSPISPARLVFVSALVILVALVVWVAVRSVGPSPAGAVRPIVVLPSPLASAASPSPAGTPSATPPVSPTARRSPSARAVSSSPSARRSSSPSPARRPPAPSARFTAAVRVTASWDDGYVAVVQVVNSGTQAASWSVAVTHSGLTGLRLDGTWNAQGRQAGASFTFAGGPLGPGQSATFGYQADKQGPGPARPSGCSTAGGSCRVN